MKIVATEKSTKGTWTILTGICTQRSTVYSRTDRNQSGSE